jgi:hypothetical protein
MKQLICNGKIREGAVRTLTLDEYSVILDSDLEYACLDPVLGIDGSIDIAWADYLIRTGPSKDIPVVFRKPNDD